MDEKVTNQSQAENVEAVENEEVKEIKEEVVDNTPSMEDYAEEIESTFIKLSEGDIVEGKILSVTDTEILVNIGYISDGIIPAEEILRDSDVSLKELYKPDEIIKAKVTDLHDGEGNVLLSIKKAEQIIVWDELKDAFEKGTILHVVAKEVVKGGIVCNIKGIRAFMPASRVSVNYVENLNEFIGKEMTVNVIDFDAEKNKVVISRKEIEKEELEKKKQELLKNINKNDRLTGVVKRLTNFGAFVDIGGIDGLVHINDLSWKRVKHPSEVVNVGDNVEVYVLEVNKEKERISLGLKNVNDDPWLNVKEKYIEGNVYEGTVVRLLSFGAFVMLEGGIEGLVHISEIADKRIEKPEDVLEIGDKVTVKLLALDEDNKKIKLSIKEAKDDVNKEELNKYNDDSDISTSLKDVFKDLMDKF
ncbi:MAG: 30S ribosomal protein S1 [Vallitalea sp.]|jgi:small subunit ribosomal protein S1|nr:30S ribosomal protein S1 [Vallitalea sp.]